MFTYPFNVEDYITPSPEWSTRNETQQDAVVQVKVDENNNLCVSFPMETETYERVELKVSFTPDQEGVKFVFTASSHHNGMYNSRTLTAVLDDFGSYKITGLRSVQLYRDNNEHIVAIFPKECYTA